MRKPDRVEVIAIGIDHLVEAVSVLMFISMIAVWAALASGA